MGPGVEYNHNSDYRRQRKTRKRGEVQLTTAFQEQPVGVDRVEFCPSRFPLLQKGLSS